MGANVHFIAPHFTGTLSYILSQVSNLLYSVTVTLALAAVRSVALTPCCLGFAPSGASSHAESKEGAAPDCHAMGGD